MNQPDKMFKTAQLRALRSPFKSEGDQHLATAFGFIKKHFVNSLAFLY